MDWPWFLASYWNLVDLRPGKIGWSKTKSLEALPNAGTLMFETHIYTPGTTTNSIGDLDRFTSWFRLQIALVEAFTVPNPGIKVFLGEYAFNQLSPNLNL